MKTNRSLRAGRMVPLLILALLVNPLVYGVAQAPAVPATGDHQPPDSTSLRAGDQTATSPNAKPFVSNATSSGQLPDSPGTAQTQSGQASVELTPQNQDQQPTTPQSQNRTHEPVGTAAAESVPTSGVAASRPAGAALAPAKQRRIRSILIKTGALVGAGVAIGATMALSEGSPSRPPGAH